MLDIVTRRQWGASPWTGDPHEVDPSEKLYFVGHYHGGKPAATSGVWVPRNVENIHLANGWFGIGYNHLIDQEGTVYEGRGWDLVGAHCPSRNRNGWGVYFAVGGDQAPSAAAKAAARKLYDEACERADRKLILGTHGDYYDTECAGEHVDEFFHNGLDLSRPGGAQSVPVTIPAPRPPKKKGRIVMDNVDLRDVRPYVTGPGVKPLQRLLDINDDGYGGPRTRDALGRAQNAAGLPRDYIFGPNTAAALLAGKGGIH